MFGTAQTRSQSRTRMGATQALSLGIPAELVTFVRKTYGLLTFSLFLAAAAAWGMTLLFPIQVVEQGGKVFARPTFPQWGIYALWAGTFVFSMIGNAAKNGARQGEPSLTGLLGLCGMVVCAGAMLGPTIGLMAGVGMTGVVVSAVVTTALTFTGLTAFVFLTGKNFSFMGGFLTIAFFAFFLAWILGSFFAGPGTMWWMAAVGAVLFCGMILFHTSSVVHFYGPNNLVIPAVIALFIDIFNLFVMLLTIFSGRGRD